jgi:hypothetical protein
MFAAMDEPKDRLAHAEWDFRDLVHKNPTLEQRQELHAAIRYEYARESESIRRLADEFAALSEEDHLAAEHARLTYRKKYGFVLEKECHGVRARAAKLAADKRAKLVLFTALPFWNCIFWPKFFPNTPWLCIPPKERLRRIRSFVETLPPARLEINELDDPTELELPKKGGRMFVDNTRENIILSIDWAEANNEQIISAFGKWIRNSRPPDIPEPRGDASRQNVTAAFLTRLAVMRLLHHYRFWDARGARDPFWGAPGAPGAREIALDLHLKMPRRQSNALRMRKKVAADLRKIFLADLLKTKGEPLIPSNERPLSWSTVPEQHQQSRWR